MQSVRGEIAAAAERCGRTAADITLIAVSKTRPASDVRKAASAGCRHFGENYLQEAVSKIEALQDVPLCWHFIGAVQSNKTRLIAEHFDWVHTVARPRIAERLSGQCPSGKVLNVTLQVNVDEDPDKAGVAPEDAAPLLETAAALPNLRVRGLMTILRRDSDPLCSYRRLADLFAGLAERRAGAWDTLSMGMSGDFAAAIAAGATHVRIGTALFGPRT